MKKTLKTLLGLGLLITSCGLAGCGSEGGNAGGGTGGGGTSGGGEKEPSKDAYVEVIKTDWIELAVGSEAHDHWYCDKLYYEYKFNKEGKCDYYHTCYNFPDASKYEYVNEHLQDANYKPVWSVDHSGFYFASTYITTMTPKKALDSMDEKYYPYTITYSDKVTKYVGVPSEAQKAADLLANLGITKEIFVIAPGSNPQIYNQTKVQIGCKLTCAGANMSIMNKYAVELFGAIKAIADNNKIYDYFDYSEVIAECPQATNEFESLYFMYRFNDNKFNVKVSHDENELNVAIQLYK